MKRSRLWLGLLVLAVLAAAYLLGHSGSTPGVARAREEAEVLQYNFVASDVVVRQTGDDGKLQYRLQATRVEQRPEDRQISASDLTVHYEPEEAKSAAAGGQWKLTASRAVLPDDGKPLQLRGAVQVTGQPPQASGPVTVNTESLDYDLRTQDINSADIVELRMGTQSLQGRGLHANIRLGTLALDSEVRGVIAR